MNNKTHYLLVLLVFFGLNLPLAVFAQKAQKPFYTQEQIKVFLHEVYQDQTEPMFYQAHSTRLAMVTDFLNRIAFLPHGKNIQKKLPLLSSLELEDSYNPHLKRDILFDPKTFNPLKYNFAMSAHTKILVRVDASDYVIAIEPIQ